MKKILLVYGTRPEAIKMAPVVQALRSTPEACELTVCSTGQHRDMLDQVQELFGLSPDIDLNLMRSRQGLNELCARAFVALDSVLDQVRPDWVLVQGDTTSAMVAAMTAFHRGIAVGHVEAGLRTGDLGHPFPEEANRRMVDLVATSCFAPTARARDALLAEGISKGKIFLTGNTVVDAIETISPRLTTTADGPTEVLITAHRRESFGSPIRAIFRAIAELASEYSEIRWVYPVHSNPEVGEPAAEILGPLPNVELHPPFDYLELLRRLKACRLVLTDSGGIQEEAPSFGKPVLVLRETTERPEGVEAGIARLVGVAPHRIVSAVHELLSDPEEYRAMSGAPNPYGDGRAAERIASILTGRPWRAFEPPAERPKVGTSTPVRA